MNVVAENAAVPFNAAGSPSISDSKVAGAHNRIAIEQITIFFFINKAHKLSAPFGKEGCLEIFVFKHNSVHFAVVKLSCVHILHFVRIRRRNVTVADIKLIIFAYSGVTVTEPEVQLG
jgi:hypothetical protein